MSASFEIAASTGSYRVDIESGAFERHLRAFSSAAYLSDDFFASTFDQAQLIATLIEATEANKSLDASPKIIERLRKSGANRQTELVAVGGGTIQDLSAFIASIYMRGLRWSYLPTTLLAMVDSCIGGKSSINVGPYKNLVGTFHPPRQVLIDPAVVQTLPDDQKASGLVEAAKICFCRGAESFERYLSLEPSAATSIERLEALIVTSLEAKKWFIEIDEFDKGERLLLNFGHTFGHAIEGASHFAIAHGIAVGLGILCALEFERQRGTDYGGCPRVRLLEEHLETLLSSVGGLPALVRGLAVEDVMERFESDKKHGAENYTLILVAEDGTVALRRIAKSAEQALAVRSAIGSVVDRFGS